MDEEPTTLVALANRHREIARLLGNPGPSGLGVQATCSTRRVPTVMKNST